MTKIDTLSASIPLPKTAVREQSHQLQSVFSEVLETVGRRGYESAQMAEGEPVTVEIVKTAWSGWFEAERDGRYAMAERPEDLKQKYGQVLTQALNEGGYAMPIDFLKGLTKDELKVVQNVNWLAKPIDVNSLTEEGALNLLLPGAAQVDLNQDGLTQAGIGYGVRFPDSNTPAEVVVAWDKATASLSAGEKVTYELQMKMPLVTANIFVGEDGAYSHRYEPGDVEFRNPMAEPGFSYQQTVQGQLDELEFVKDRIPYDQYERQTTFWKNFLELLGGSEGR